MSSSSNGHHPANGAKFPEEIRGKHQEKLQLDGNGASGACQKDRLYIEKLERELRNCYQEIDYLQDQLNMRNAEANFMGEHIHSLELKLTELEKFPERVRAMDDELMRSDSQCWLLMEEMQCKEEELQKAASQIEKLENAILDCQCEIESLKLESTTLEQRLFDAESFGQQVAEGKTRIEKQLRESELQLLEAHNTIGHLEVENKELKELLPRSTAKQYPFTAGKQLDKTLEIDGHADYERDNAFLEKMAKQNEESELLIEQLKEELREQKLPPLLAFSSCPPPPPLPPASCPPSCLALLPDPSPPASDSNAVHFPLEHSLGSTAGFFPAGSFSARLKSSSHGSQS